MSTGAISDVVDHEEECRENEAAREKGFGVRRLKGGEIAARVPKEEVKDTIRRRRRKLMKKHNEELKPPNPWQLEREDPSESARDLLYSRRCFFSSVT